MSEMPSEAIVRDALSSPSRDAAGGLADHSGPGPDERALQNDIRLLDGLLDATILRLEGEASFRLVEEVRAAAQRLRADPSLEAARRLRDRLTSAGLGELRTLTRAFSFYFDLINLAEQQARLRTLRRRAGQVPARPLAKADLTIARLYADLVDDAELANEIFRRIETEFQTTVDFVCRITGQPRLLDNSPVLQSSIARRNPYVDPLSFVQLALLKRIRSGEEPRGELLTAALESINGIASGLKNTG